MNSNQPGDGRAQLGSLYGYSRRGTPTILTGYEDFFNKTRCALDGNSEAHTEITVIRKD